MFADKQTGKFTHSSENIVDFIEESPEQLLGADALKWLRDMLPDAPALPLAAGQRLLLARALDLGEGDIDLIVSTSSSGWFLEFEMSPDSEPV